MTDPFTAGGWVRGRPNKPGVYDFAAFAAHEYWSPTVLVRRVDNGLRPPAPVMLPAEPGFDSNAKLAWVDAQSGWWQSLNLEGAVLDDIANSLATDRSSVWRPLDQMPCDAHRPHRSEAVDVPRIIAWGQILAGDAAAGRPAVRPPRRPRAAPPPRVADFEVWGAQTPDKRPTCPTCGAPARVAVVRANVTVALRPDGTPQDFVQTGNQVLAADVRAFRCAGRHEWAAATPDPAAGG